MNTLKLTNLSKTYPNGVKALDAISLTITDGMFGLLGPNGAGKSSLMRTISALQEPSSGSLQFNDIDILKNPQQLRQQLGYLPQEFGVYPRFSAYKLLDHIAILKGVLNRGERKDQVEALLQQTNLYDHRKKWVHNFSGGMKQRFGIAQALLGDPKLIIVDEPTAGLDPEERNRFHNLLSDIASSKVVILSTHIVEDVHDLCTQMAILQEGKIITKGIPLDLVKEKEGTIWSAIIPKDELDEYQNRYTVISTQLLAGKTQIHVFAESKPSPMFEIIQTSLEDLYFTSLYTNNK